MRGQLLNAVYVHKSSTKSDILFDIKKSYYTTNSIHFAFMKIILSFYHNS